MTQHALAIERIINFSSNTSVSSSRVPVKHHRSGRVDHRTETFSAQGHLFCPQHRDSLGAHRYGSAEGKHSG